MTTEPENEATGLLDADIELSIVMPCLNEAETLELCIKKAKQFLFLNRINGEVIISDNGSKDGSLEIAEKAGAEIVHVKKRGYGNALSKGMEAAKGKFIIIGDSDDSYDFSSLGGFIEKFHKGWDLVMGCRLPSGNGTIKKGAMPFLHRYFGNPFLSKMGKLLFEVPVNDFHCGLRGITKTAFELMQLKSSGMEFASEMVIKAKLLNLKITEIPITLYPDGRSGKPHLNSYQDGWRHFRLLFLYCPKMLFFFPGIVLSAFGFIGMAIMYGLSELHIFNIILSVNSVLIFSLSFLSGNQLIFLGFIAGLLAAKIGLVPKQTETLFSKPVIKVRNFYFSGFISFAAGLFFVSYHVLLWGYGGFTIDINIYHYFIKNMIVYISMIFFGFQMIFFGFLIDMLKLINDK